MGAERAGQAREEAVEEQPVAEGMTVKELKEKHKEMFQREYEKYYPVAVFERLGFARQHCASCGKFFWARGERPNCGDSLCRGSYGFIGRGAGIGRQGRKISYAEAYKTFERSFTNARKPCTAIPRYPIVARWRNDVEYVAAGIYCFQPYCVTGELEPPANPLICPQFCVRFNDLDNIGLTGRHYSGFVMLGIQVFNYPHEHHFFKEECVEFNYNWLTEELGIAPEEITFTEDLWAGGGNMGPCIEYFVEGMELGNMVFMQFKTFHDGSYEELPVKVIDTGIGLERVAWVVNGEPTSYFTVFAHAYAFLVGRLGLNVDRATWEAFGPYSSQLDVDENPDLPRTWQRIAELVGTDAESIRRAIEPLRDVFIVLDHTRTALMLIRDGALPSNTGGGANLRNIIRRAFAVMQKQGWWAALPLDGFLELFEHHKRDLEQLYGSFAPYSSFDDIIRLEHRRWQVTDEVQKQRLRKLLETEKELSLESWAVATTSWGVPAETIAQIAGRPIPDNLYYFIAQRQERVVKAPEQILYETHHLPETVCLYLEHHQRLNPLHDLYRFAGRAVEVFANVAAGGRRDILVLDQTGFYPTSGGQLHDTGHLHLAGQRYEVLSVEKAGKCVLHVLDRPVEDWAAAPGAAVEGEIDRERRLQLRNHHTATHIVFAACRRVLGPHVWQNGAKKTPQQAHLDITHFAALSVEEELAIERAANEIVLANRPIVKGVRGKAEAEKAFGFSLYQGGVVPGSQLRVVDIVGVDVEACCGTHCDSTAEVGWVKLLSTKRIADGTVRLYFVAGARTLATLGDESLLLRQLQELWGIPQDKVLETAQRFFGQAKRQEKELDELQKRVMGLELRALLEHPARQRVLVESREENPKLYFAQLGQHARELREKRKNICYVGKTFVFLFAGDGDQGVVGGLREHLGLEVKVLTQMKVKGGSVKDVLVITAVSDKKLRDPIPFLEAQGYERC